MITYINGEFQKNKRIVSINDRGYLLGDGLYDTILYKDSALTFFNFHYQFSN